MIPADLAARLRLLSESVVQPVGHVREIAADLPELPVGQRFTARIESALPDGSFRAVVAGRSLALALPEAAAAGDTLDLVVTGRLPRLIAAQRAEAAASSPPQLAVGQRFVALIESDLQDGTYRTRVAGSALRVALPEAAEPGKTLELVVTGISPRFISAERAGAALSGRTLLSPTGQLLGALLANEQPPQAPTIFRTEPLLARPSEQAAALAQALKQAVSESGLFYEAHQAEWIAGRHPLEALRREPQARLARLATRGEGQLGVQGTNNVVAAHEAAGAEAAQPRAGAAALPGIADEMQPLVQQQLDAAATQHIVWRGELWPGQSLHWEIESGERQGGEAQESETRHWTASLRLTLPRLGEISAVLRLDAEKVSLAMTASADHADSLRQGLGALASAFAAADLPPLAAGVKAHG